MSAVLEGDRELLAKLAKLDQKVATKALRKAINAGSKIMLKAIKARAPKQGEIKKSLGRKVKQKKGQVTAYIGPRVNYQGKGKSRKKGRAKESNVEPFRLAHFFERGTKERVVAATGKPAGRHPKVPFVQPGFNDGKRATQEEIKTVLAQEISVL